MKFVQLLPSGYCLCVHSDFISFGCFTTQQKTCKLSLIYKMVKSMPEGLHGTVNRIAIVTTCAFCQSRIERKQVVCEHWTYQILILPRICVSLTTFRIKTLSVWQDLPALQSILQSWSPTYMSWPFAKLWQHGLHRVVHFLKDGFEHSQVRQVLDKQQSSEMAPTFPGAGTQPSKV